MVWIVSAKERGGSYCKWVSVRTLSTGFCRQRKHISQLEQKVRESELQVHSALLGRPAPFGDVCLLRLQVSIGSQDGSQLALTQCCPGLVLLGIQEIE